MQNSLTIIIPAYNEEQGIRETLETLLPTAQKYKWKLCVINDASTDRTGELAGQVPGVEVIHHPYNKGYGAGLKTGIKAAKTEYVAFYDADGQHRPEDLETLVGRMDSYDMLVGKRGKTSHQDWVRKPGKWMLGKIANYLTERKIPDLNSGLRVARRKAILPLLPLFPNGFSFSTTSTIAFMNMGLNIDYVPIVVNRRVGTSSVKQLKHGSQTILLMLRLIVLFNPLKVFLPTSLSLVALGILYEILFGILFPASGVITFLPMSFIIIISGILIFFFGLVVDQISELRKQQVTLKMD